MKITCTDYDLTDSIRDKVKDFEESLKRYFQKTDEVQVTLSRETPSQFRVDIQAYIYGKTIRSQYLSHNFHNAFKQGSDHFIDSIIKTKEILTDQKTKGTKRAEEV